VSYRIGFNYLAEPKGFPARTLSGKAHITHHPTGDLKRCVRDAGDAIPVGPD
jgi:hypothetical protein